MGNYHHAATADVRFAVGRRRFERDQHHEIGNDRQDVEHDADPAPVLYARLQWDAAHFVGGLNAADGGRHVGGACVFLVRRVFWVGLFGVVERTTNAHNRADGWLRCEWMNETTSGRCAYEFCWVVIGWWWVC